jgi:hypothetical protein
MAGRQTGRAGGAAGGRVGRRGGRTGSERAGPPRPTLTASCSCLYSPWHCGSSAFWAGMKGSFCIRLITCTAGVGGRGVL